MTTTPAPTRRYRPAAINAVSLGGLWGERADAVASTTVGILLDRCKAAGMFDQIDPTRPVPDLRLAFLPLPDGTPGTVTTQMFWDSDVAKALEAAAYSVHRRPDPTLEARVDEVVEMYRTLQREDGYCNSWYIRMQPGGEWNNLRDCHELYCAGHLMEAAVAYAQATGKRTFLEVMCRYADLIERTFGPGGPLDGGFCGHEEIELALVRLGREAGEPRYLALAKHFVDVRGASPHWFDLEERARGGRPEEHVQRTYEYSQSHLPVREQDRVVGHAVRAMYLYCGMADVATEFDDDGLTGTLEALWEDLTRRQIYVTGGIGPEAHNEGFAEPFHLPNDTAYAETCAAVSVAFWASRMLGRTLDRRYGDTMESALLNGALVGLSHAGDRFFYDNPLSSGGHHHRWEWHSCPCCPPNIARTITSIGSYMYSVADDAVAVHLYGASTARLDVAGTTVTLDQRTAYPWDGRIDLSVGLEGPARFALSLRLPEWCDAPSVAVNGERIDLSDVGNGGYLTLDREWRDADAVSLDLPMEVQAIRADPRVASDIGRAAVSRGPLVYCAEAADNAFASSEGERRLPLNATTLPVELSDVRTARAEGLSDAIALDVPVNVPVVEEWGDALYRTGAPVERQKRVTLVPYFLWDNRAPGEMVVWLRQR